MEKDVIKEAKEKLLDSPIMKYVLVDNRLRKEETNKLEELGYIIVEIPKNDNVYEEISSHVDIFCTKLKDKVIVEPIVYDYLKTKIDVDRFKILKGNLNCKSTYPQDILYNVCTVGDNAIHNFKYTDSVVLEQINNLKLKKINVSQGYANCSIAVIDERSVITSDRGIYDSLLSSGIDVLLVPQKLDIKLIGKDGYSNMKGFIGGAISRLGENIFVTGDLSKIDKGNKIRKYIEKKGLNIIDFKKLDVVDYGKIVEIKG